jgi:hypothetical protein
MSSYFVVGLKLSYLPIVFHFYFIFYFSKISSSSSITFQVKEISSSSSSKFCNFIYSILKEIINDDEGCMLVVDLLDTGFSLEVISEFVMRNF